MTKYFEALAEIFGMHGWIFFFATFCFVGAAFVMLVVPETKGKSYAEIAEILKR